MVRIDNRHVKFKGWKNKDHLHLRSATEVHWRGLKQNSAEKRQLHVVLSTLPIIPNIRLLSLCNADINEAQQTIIFGLSTLRTLVVQRCHFHPLTRAPPFSHVTALKLANIDTQTTRRLLTIFASTLETLSVGYLYGTIDSILQGGLVELPKLSTFTIERHEYGTIYGFMDTFKRYTSITTLHFSFPYNFSDLSVHHSDFPALRSLTCDHHLAVILMPERPVTTYVEIFVFGRERFLTLLNALSTTRVGITNLKLFVHDNLSLLLPSLAAPLQHLEQLTLMFCPGTPLLSTRSPLYPSGQPLHNPPGAATVVLPKLKWVTISVDEYRYSYFPPESLLNECFIPLCPVLEVFEYLYFAVSNPSFELDRLPEPKRVWKVRRLPDGSWERQGPPPIPIPIPIPGKILRAAP